MLNLQEQAVLDPALQFEPSPPNYTQELQGIFLTGASGFFGVYLLDELLRTTKADIYCLMRCPAGIESGQQRIETHLREYGLWQDEFARRVIAVPGDLSKPRYGLSRQEFSALADKVDVIYHNGAWVNSLYPYSILKPSNVDGTVETLKLAGLGRAKPLHFVSTVAVFFTDSAQEGGQLFLETNTPPPPLKGGYRQSKWVAENLVRQAQQRGLPASIYRTARIMGHSQTGITQNFNDNLISMMKMCIHLGKYPDCNSTLSLIPVDFAAQSLVYLSQQPASAGNTFHLLNPQAIAWNEFFGQVSDCGYPLDKVSPEIWQGEVKTYASGNKDSKLSSLARLLLKSMPAMFDTKPEFDMQQTLADLSGSKIDCPPVDKALVSTWLSYLQRCGQLGCT
jgi:thioester reductase-like protein